MPASRYLKSWEIVPTQSNRSAYILWLIFLFSIRAQTHWTDKICLALPKISTKFVRQIFNLSILGALKNSKIFVNHKVSITWKLNTISPVTRTCTGAVCIRMCIWFGLHRDVQIEQYLDLEMQLESKLGKP